jgi:riboflavin synthase
MFTGIIEGLGTIISTCPFHQGRKLTISADFSLVDSKIGDSIAVSGVCLTATEIKDRQFKVDVSPETLNTTILKELKTGERVNLERALRLSDRIDGHLVSGHVDGTGKLNSKTNKGNVTIVTIEVDPSLSYHMIKKGSVAVDGVSLTINQCDQDRFSVSIVPHTAKLTTITLKSVGSLVNVETDMIGKYVERFVLSAGKKGIKSERTVNKHFLTQTGFLP